MADTTAKKLDQASRLINEINALMAALYRASIIVAEVQSAGLRFSDEDFESTGIAHLETTNIDDVFNAVRP